jgi:hypothetical protein
MIDKKHVTGNKGMSGKDVTEIIHKFNKSGHAKTNEIFEIREASKLVWTLGQ